MFNTWIPLVFLDFFSLDTYNILQTLGSRTIPRLLHAALSSEPKATAQTSQQPVGAGNNLYILHYT